MTFFRCWLLLFFCLLNREHLCLLPQRWLFSDCIHVSCIFLVLCMCLVLLRHNTSNALRVYFPISVMMENLVGFPVDDIFLFFLFLCVVCGFILLAYLVMVRSTGIWELWNSQVICCFFFKFIYLCSIYFWCYTYGWFTLRMNNKHNGEMVINCKKTHTRSERSSHTAKWIENTYHHATS